MVSSVGQISWVYSVLCFGVDLVGFNWISQVSLVGEVSPD